MRQVTLQELGKIVTGNTPSKTEEKNYLSDDIPFIKPDDFFSFSEINTSVSNRHFISELARTKARIVPKNTVLVTCIGNIGKVMIADSEVAFNQQINGIVTNEKVLPGYLAYQLLHHKLRLEFIANAPVVPIINKTQFSEFTLEIHECLNVQENIVNILDLVSHIIQKRKKYLNVLDTLVKSRFNEMFGEEKFSKVKVGETLETTSGGTPSKTKPEYYKDGIIPWLTSGEIHAGFIEQPQNFITELGLKNSSAKLVPANSIVIAMYGATAGVTGLVKYTTSTNQAVCSLLPNDKFIPEYLYYSISRNKEWMIAQSRGGGQPNISQAIIQSMVIIDAPLPLQEEFARFVEAVDKSKLTVKKSLEELETLKKKLMQDYFG